jgi:phosphoserine aminotransferase
MMNAVFLLDAPLLQKEFIDAATAEGIVGIEGHRSVGGCRVSLYNAIPLSSVEILVDFIKEFARKKS